MVAEIHADTEAEAERAVLDILLIWPATWRRVSALLKAEHFQDPIRRLLYEAIMEDARATKLPDFLGALRVFKGKKLPDWCEKSHATIITEATEECANPAKLEHYANLLRSSDAERKAREIVLTLAAEPGQYGADQIARGLEVARRTVAEAEEPSSSGFTKLRDVLGPAISEWERRASKDAATRPWASTGLRDLDEMLDGLAPGWLIVVGARPGMGKTSLALNIAMSVAKQNRGGVAVFSLETAILPLAQRALTIEAKVSVQAARAGGSEAWRRLYAAGENLAPLPIFLNDRRGLTVDAMCGAAKDLADRESIAMVVVDYLQLCLSDRRTPKDTREREVAYVSRAFKGLAMDLRLPVLAACQLNRESEGRPGGRPKMSDLRESGEIEADADVVLLLHRENRAGLSPITAIVEKNRHGPTGPVDLGCDPATGRFWDLAREGTFRVPEE